VSTRHRVKLVREGEYAAEVAVELIDPQTGWAPYLSAEDAQRLDEVREALRRGDIDRAGQSGRVFRLTPITV
jgi:hypothetical protein